MLVRNLPAEQDHVGLGSADGDFGTERRAREIEQVVQNPRRNRYVELLPERKSG